MSTIVSADAELIHEMFISPGKQLDLARERSMERDWCFTDDDFAALGEPPTWPEDKLSVVVLDISIDTVEHTFEEAWHFAASVQPNHWRWNELKSDADHLRLLPGITHKRGLRWRVVDLGANLDKAQGMSPREVRRSSISPSSEVLWAASYFPNLTGFSP
jgi:hypothetical protein